MTINRNLANLANQLNTDGEVPKIEVGNTSVAVTDTGSNGAIAFTTEGSEKMTVNSSGFLGINTNPTAYLHVGGAVRNGQWVFLSKSGPATYTVTTGPFSAGNDPGVLMVMFRTNDFSGASNEFGIAYYNCNNSTVNTTPAATIGSLTTMTISFAVVTSTQFTVTISTTRQQMVSQVGMLYGVNIT